MTYASQDLINEHEGILFGLKILDKMRGMIGTKERLDPLDAGEMVEFFKLFADKCHHGKEEGLLFPEMEKAGIKNAGGPIGQMLAEHVEGRKHVSRMAGAFEGNRFDAESFANAASDYILLLRSHIEKENQVLFPMGDKAIPIEIQNELLEKFEKHEEEVMGRGTHEKLHELLRRFEKKYLGE